MIVSTFFFILSVMMMLMVLMVVSIDSDKLSKLWCVLLYHLKNRDGINRRGGEEQ